MRAFSFIHLTPLFFFPEKVLVFKKRDSKKECWVVVVIVFFFVTDVGLLLPLCF